MHSGRTEAACAQAARAIAASDGLVAHRPAAMCIAVGECPAASNCTATGPSPANASLTVTARIDACTASGLAGGAPVAAAAPIRERAPPVWV
jgi:hypothetical protein